VTETLALGIRVRGVPGWLAAIALHQLPASPETLPLRTLGRGQEEASARVMALPPSPARELAVRLLFDWQKRLEFAQNRSGEEEQLMVTSSAEYLTSSAEYLKWQAEQQAIGE